MEEQCPPCGRGDYREGGPPTPLRSLVITTPLAGGPGPANVGRSRSQQPLVTSSAKRLPAPLAALALRSPALPSSDSGPSRAGAPCAEGPAGAGGGPTLVTPGAAADAGCLVARGPEPGCPDPAMSGQFRRATSPRWGCGASWALSPRGGSERVVRPRRLPLPRAPAPRRSGL